MRRRPRLRPEPGDRRTDSFLRAVRAPRLSLLRPRLPGLRRPRAHHRHLEAHPLGAPLRAAVHGARADGARDHQGPLPHPPGSRRRRLPRGGPPLHPDARCPRIGIDNQNDLLAWELRVKRRASRGVLEHRAVTRQRAFFLKPLSRLFEAADLPDHALPPQLAELYDGGLAIPEGGVYANFVSSIDGIVALEGGTAPSGGIISGRNEADRFVMGLLRAFADAVLVGAGTVRAEGGKALWTPDYIFPAAAKAFADLRQTLNREKTPRLVIVCGSDALDPSERALEAGALWLTTAPPAKRLLAVLPNATGVRALSDTDHIDIDDTFDALYAEGYRTILSEGGPQLFGELVSHDRIDELFLTVSPVLEGQSDQSFGMIRGVDFGRTPKRSRLLSVRRHESHLFVRYQLEHS